MSKKAELHHSKVWSSRRLYAFCIVSCATFLLGMIYIASSAENVRVDNDMRFRLNSQDEHVIAGFKDDLFNAMRFCTTDKQIINRLRKLSDQHEFSANDLGVDLDSIRERLDIFTRVQPMSNLAEVKISYKGSGSVAEKHFIQSLAEDVLLHVKPSCDLSKVESALANVSDHLQTHQANQTTYARSLKAMIDDYDGQLANLENELAEQHANLVAQGKQLDDNSLVENEINQIQARIDQLENDKSSLISQADEDPQQAIDAIDEIDNLLGNLNNRLAELQNGGTSNSPFRKISFSRKPEVQANQALTSSVRNRINTIELDQVSESVSLIENHRIQDLNSPIEYIAKIKGKMGRYVTVTPAAELLEPGAMSSEVIGGGNNQQLVLVLILAVFAGGFLTIAYNPKENDRGFTDQDRMAKDLGVPIVSQFPLNSQRAANGRDATLQKLVWGAEVVVIACICLVVITCVLSADIRNSLTTNPIEGFSRIILMIRGR